jgi:hypothetical protein
MASNERETLYLTVGPDKNYSCGDLMHELARSFLHIEFLSNH